MSLKPANELLNITRTIENLLPWEPVVSSKISRNFFTYEWEPEKDDSCLECESKHFELGIMISDNAGSCFCSWECLIKRATHFSDYYVIHDKGCY